MWISNLLDGLQGKLRPSLKKLPSEACLVNFSHLQGYKFGGHCLGGVCIASLRSISRSLSLFYLLHTQLSTPEFPTKRQTTKLAKRAYICYTSYCCLKRTWRKHPSSFVMGDALDGTLAFLDILKFWRFFWCAVPVKPLSLPLSSF